MRVLVTGAGGLLAAAIVREFADADVHAVSHGELDIADVTAVGAAVARTRPDVIVNCAAYNDVDRAEQDASTALRVNAFGVLALAHAARDAGGLLVHFSTDFVFDGEADRPYVEEDAPNPRSVYAASKLLGEWFAADVPSCYVLRVASLFGKPGPAGGRRGSLGVIIDRIRSGAEVPVFVDRTVSPSYTSDVARATRVAIERRLPSGVYHCANAGAGSWAEVGAEAARLLGRPFRMKPLTLASAGLAAARPRYCALSPAKLAGLGIVMPPWQDALSRYISEGA
ncbi:MAG: dTDP-4-dehydrorhamnose reductase [Acidobacteriota bacterium]|nr:dTDP-4-dehydrorhamnose reductase [Acidobacteriota bacterium]